MDLDAHIDPSKLDLDVARAGSAARGPPGVEGGRGHYLMPACGFIKASGEACKAIPMKGEGWCYVHHPQYQARRRRDGRKGGKRGGRGRPVADLTSLKDRLEELAEDVLAGRVDRADAAVAGQLLNYAVRAVAVGLKAREAEELEARLEELEASLERQKGKDAYGPTG